MRTPLLFEEGLAVVKTGYGKAMSNGKWQMAKFKWFAIYTFFEP
jgi:hypothetical protein